MEATKMTYAAAIALYDLIGKILVDVKDGKGVERPLPFQVQFKLNRAANQLAKDYDYVSSKKDELVRENGELDETTNMITVTDEEKKKVVLDALSEIYQTVTEHTFTKLTQAEVLEIKLDDIQFTAQEVGLFVSALVDLEEPEAQVEASEPAVTDDTTDGTAEVVES